MSRAEEGFTENDSEFTGFVLDPEKCSTLNLEQKRKLVHDIARQSRDAPTMLRSFTRRELLEIICAEMGEERKYTGYSKNRMIESLLKLVSKKAQRSDVRNVLTCSTTKSHIGSKRKRNIAPSVQDLNYHPSGNSVEDNMKTLLCQNVVCRATLNTGDSFCKRCSCCICHRYDDNKDPSLWLTCSSDLPDEKESCGMSCHLECALKDGRAGILNNGCHATLEGSFYCVSCGKINELMRTWRKQLISAKEARRVDTLCQRISLAHKILIGTEVYKEVHKTVETAVQLLNSEVGPPDQVCSEEKEGPICSIHFEESSPTSVVVVLEYEDHLLKNFLGCRLWHRMSTMKEYPEQPTFIILRPEKRFKLDNLHPSTEYFCKVSLFSSTGTLGVTEAKWVTAKKASSSPPKMNTPGNNQTRHLPTVCSVTAFDQHETEEDKIGSESHCQVKCVDRDIDLLSGDQPAKHLLLHDINKRRFEGFHSKPPLVDIFEFINPVAAPFTPCKSNGMRTFLGSGCKKQLESDYEYSVRAIKWLEHGGHIDETFRVKFLTWFSLKATVQERRVVNVFVDALIDDPPSLAGQLMHTFMEEIC
ncbi:VIN3-like protein 2 [Quillaja saponaria]|uniref:VIN3-like protein 2 n=1 Tax=Quillaja saponaria TaxID=32244 RepID=A0AAD7LWW2_QUISA|nr:VIN3-like protein 2 [Quillaja saponaria]